MVWAIRPDGVNDTMNFTQFTIPANEDFTIRMIFSLDGVSNRSFAGQSGAFNNVIRMGGTSDIRFVASGVQSVLSFSSPIADLTVYDIEIQRTGGATGTIDVVDTATQNSLLTSTVTNANALALNGFFRFGNSSFLFKGDFQHFEVTSTSNNLRWNATDSSHGTGTPVLTETLTANNATGVNMATNGSVWIDLGGGGDTDINANKATKSRNTYAATVVAEVDTNISANKATKTRNTYQATVSVASDTIINANKATKGRNTYSATVVAEVDTNISANKASKTRNTYQATISVDNVINATKATKSRNVYPATVDAQVDVNINANKATKSRNVYSATISTTIPPKIDGQLSVTINTDGGELTVYFNGTDYFGV